MNNTKNPLQESQVDYSSTLSLIKPFNSLSELLEYPSVLSSETSLLTSELTSLCHSSHSTFLLLHSTSTTLSTSFQSLSTSLDSLLSTIPSLNAATLRFSEETRPILEERRKATLLLEQREKLTDLLDIPALIDSCARNGLYQEAIELSDHVQLLSEQLRQSDGDSEKLRIVRSLEREVEGSVKLMLSGLINTLKDRVKPPALYRAMGFLRRMTEWDEEKLAILFLCCRGVLIDTLHASNEEILANGVAPSGSGRISDQDVAKYLKGYVDIFREGVYDTVTGYVTVFLDPVAASPQASPVESGRLRSLLSTFADLQITKLIQTLSTHLPSLHDFNSLSSLLTQLNFCGSSFARIGLDFRPLLITPFEIAITGIVKDAITTANTELSSAFLDYEEARSLPSEWLILQVANSSPNSISLPEIPDSQTKTDPPFIAPQVLTFSPVLASLLNVHLTTFNSLRLLPILSLCHPIHNLLCESLAMGLRTILRYARSLGSPSSPTSKVSFERSRASMSLERRNSELVGSQPRRTFTSDSQGRPMSPGLQRSNTPTTPRPFSPTPRQGFTSEERMGQERAIILTVGKAYTKVMIPFLLRGLQQGVFAKKENAPITHELEMALGDWERWYEAESTPQVINGK